MGYGSFFHAIGQVYTSSALLRFQAVQTSTMQTIQDCRGIETMVDFAAGNLLRVRVKLFRHLLQSIHKALLFFLRRCVV
jgi:hypothetical protein